MLYELLQQKMLPNGLEPPLPASEAGALSLKLRKHRKKYKTKSSALQDSMVYFQKKQFISRKSRRFFKKNEIFKESIALKILFILL